MIAPNERLFFNWFLSGTDNQDHAVVDEEFARVLHIGSGLCEALCGHLVVPRSLTVPPGPRCARCQLFVKARATLSDPDLRMADRARRHRGPTFLRRLFRRPARSAACTAVPRADRAGPDRGGPAAETPPSGGAAAHHPRPRTPHQAPSPPQGDTSTERSNSMETPISATARSDFDEPDLAAEANFFSERMGWPVSIDVTHQRLLVHTGNVLDAFHLPPALAEPVAHDLSSSLMAGPVIRDDDDRWWTFITEPCPQKDVELPHDLRAARVHAVPPGEQLVIPPVVAPTSWWQQPQPGRLLPPWSAVVAISRQVINRGR